MKQKFRLIYSLFSLIVGASLFINYSGGYDGNAAGAVGEGTCSDCHGGGSTAGASVNLLGAPARFTQGQTYALTLNVNHPSAPAAGFQIVATDGSTDAMIGTFTAGSGSRLTGSDRLTHSGRNTISGGVASWAFNWTAPVSGAPNTVVFYYVGNAVNNNGGSSGDAVLSGNTSTILPIELLSFTAKTGDNKTVNVAWKTASERNNRHFVLERSGDNQKFEAITQVKGNGTSASAQNYQFTDDGVNLASNVVYYRLQQVDFDGTMTYSKVVSVDIRANVTLKVYPSLAKKGDVLQVETLNNAAIEVLNSNGQVVQAVQKSANSGNANAYKTTLTIATADLIAGRYFVRCIGNGMVKTSSFIVL